ncbi:MAG: hypothetical protein ABFR97_03750 [Thermodesulfobacteriota bacterium]
MALKKKHQNPPAHKWSLAVGSFFLVLFAIGVAVDEPSRVLEQAWQICLSCIGIG